MNEVGIRRDDMVFSLRVEGFVAEFVDPPVFNPADENLTRQGDCLGVVWAIMPKILLIPGAP